MDMSDSQILFGAASAPTFPMPKPNSDDCKLHNNYDTQDCILSGIAVVLGCIMCFFGYRLFKLLLFLSGFLSGFFISYMLCSEYLTEHLSGKVLEHKEQVFLGISAGAGLVVGLLTVCIFYLGLFVLGAAMGWFVGLALLPLLYKHSEYLSEHNWVPYVILAGFALAGGIAILCAQKIFTVLASSFLGAFCLVSAIDYFVENGTVLYYAVKLLNGHFEKSMLPKCWYTWTLLGAIPVMFISGLLVQFCGTVPGSDHKRAYYSRRQPRTAEGEPLLA